MCLFYGYFLCYLPMGLRLLIQINWSEGPWTMFSPYLLRPMDIASVCRCRGLCLSVSRCLSLSLSVSLCLSVSPSLSAPLSLCLSVSLCNRLNSRSSYGKTKGFLPNVNNRQAVQQLCATNPLAARLNNAHLNCMEGYAFFAAGVLACVQAGVDKGLVENCCVFFLAMRTAYIIAYIIAVNNLIANFRTATWFASVIIQAKLFFIAAAAASQ